VTETLRPRPMDEATMTSPDLVQWPLPAAPSSPPSAPSPRLARWLSPPGPPEARLFTHAGAWGQVKAAVLAVPGRYGVLYLIVGPETLCLVDCGSEEDTSRILRAISWLGRPRSALRYVLPSHLHFDHILGVDPLCQRLGIPLALGRVAAEHVEAARPLRFPPPLPGLRAIPTWPMQGMPVFTRGDWRGLDYGFPWSRNQFRARRGPVLRDGEVLPGLPGWTLMETPGHSDDAVSLWNEEAGWLVAGDTLRNFLGGEWNPLLADPESYADTQRRLSALPVRLVLPGHGPVFEVPLGLSALRTRPWWQP
jgi:glyoxylase-like metal-dependent hydrolase (beta-lactamase superfamily II)